MDVYAVFLLILHCLHWHEHKIIYGLKSEFVCYYKKYMCMCVCMSQIDVILLYFASKCVNGSLIVWFVDAKFRKCKKKGITMYKSC